MCRRSDMSFDTGRIELVVRHLESRITSFALELVTGHIWSIEIVIRLELDKVPR